MSSERLILLCSLAWIGVVVAAVALDYLASPDKRRFRPNRRAQPRRLGERFRSRRDAQDAQVRALLVQNYGTPTIGVRQFFVRPRPDAGFDDDEFDDEFDDDSWDEEPPSDDVVQGHDALVWNQSAGRPLDWESDAVLPDGDDTQDDVDEAAVAPIDGDDDGDHAGEGQDVAAFSLPGPVLADAATADPDAADPDTGAEPAGEQAPTEAVSVDDDEHDDDEPTDEIGADVAADAPGESEIDDESLHADLFDDGSGDLDLAAAVDDDEDADVGDVADPIDAPGGDADDLAWVVDFEDEPTPVADAVPSEVIESALAPTSQGRQPSRTTVRRRFWSELASQHEAASYGTANLIRMRKGASPQRRNPLTGKLESLQLNQADEALGASWPSPGVDPFDDAEFDR